LSAKCDTPKELRLDDDNTLLALDLISNFDDETILKIIEEALKK